MMFLPIIACLALASCSASPLSEGKDLVITDKFFLEDFLLYTGKHDIVKIFAPLNQFNFEEDFNTSSEEIEHPYTIFFVEADVEDGKTTEQGLYVFKNGKATKLLDNGRDAAANNENTIYFGASDGIYKYNEATNEAEKYGTVTDNIIQLAHNKKTNTVHYLTGNHELYELSADATTSVKVPLEDVQSVVFDTVGNMYYYDFNKNAYVINRGEDKVPKKFEGLPSEKTKVSLASSMYGASDAALFLVDDRLYFLVSNGTIFKTQFKVEVEITAAAPQPTLIQYYAKDKKIYEFNVPRLLLNKMIEEIQEFLEDQKASINAIKKGSF